jgi:hypothetical protein
MESRFYPGVQADAAQLARELRALFDNDAAFEVQTMQVSSTTVLQARKTSTLRDLTGMSAALTIKITPEHGGTRVEMGMQKWFDKAALAAVAVILSSGLLLALPALGAYWQYKLTEDAWKRPTSRARPAATCRRCPAVAGRAARSSPRARPTARAAARTCASSTPAPPAARSRKTPRRASATAAASRSRAETDVGCRCFRCRLKGT